MNNKFEGSTQLTIRALIDRAVAARFSSSSSVG
jgi:hypothetical protein